MWVAFCVWNVYTLLFSLHFLYRFTHGTNERTSSSPAMHTNHVTTTEISIYRPDIYEQIMLRLYISAIQTTMQWHVTVQIKENVISFYLAPSLPPFSSSSSTPLIYSRRNTICPLPRKKISVTFRYGTDYNIGQQSEVNSGRSGENT